MYGTLYVSYVYLPVSELTGVKRAQQMLQMLVKCYIKSNNSNQIQ